MADVEKERGLLLRYLAACISCATQPATMTAESYSWLHATIEQSNVSVEELIYLGLTRVSGAWLDKAVWTRQVRQGRPWWRDIYGVWATLKYIRYLLTARHGLVYSKYMHLIYI